MKSGASFPVALLVKSTLQRDYMSALESWENSHSITLLKIGVESPFSAKFLLMEVLNIWVFLTSTEPVGPFGMTISWLPVLVG